MPLQRRLPKRGFSSLTKEFNAEVNLTDIQRLPISNIDLLALKKAGLVSQIVRRVKLIASGKLDRKVDLSGLLATAGAKAAVEAAGGSIV